MGRRLFDSLRWRRGAARRSLPPHAAYELWAGSYGKRPNAFQRLETEVLEALLPRLAGSCFLDVGCGTGRLSGLALERGAARAVALDFSCSMLTAAHAPRAAMLARVQADALSLPLAGGSFDAVGAALLLGHVRDLAAALAEIRRVLRPGGWLVVSDFHPAATGRGWQRTFTDPATGETHRIRQYAHTLPEYRALLSELGFDLELLQEREFDAQPVVLAFRARRR